MRPKGIVLIVSAFFVISCGKNDKSHGGYVSKKWKNTKEYFVDSDSTNSIKEISYYNAIRKLYPEFIDVQKWFLSKPKELRGIKGEYYKMLSSEITNNNSITYKDLINVGDNDTFLYLFVTDDAFYICDLLVQDKKVSCKGLRKILRGFGSQPIRDLKYDTLGNLIEEVYQAEVSQDLFVKDGVLYFKFHQKGDDIDVKNIINLGYEKKFKH